MQKLSGISSGKNNRSCGIFHHKSNKIGFTFFCDFLRNLQESANSLYYFSCTFAGRPSERSLLQCSPWGAGSGGPAAIPAGDRRIPAEDG
jgi:hypothetical protein